ncbi:hypothetical protein F5Y05DRAFT_413615 [Hypoxylon sp. FL0543]|nr:hypothetical protein F5Y05DRAFT_413615 [Hypoxylon sp. FL0543]
MAREQNRPIEGRQCDKYTQQSKEIARIEMSKRCVDRETTLKASTSIANPSPVFKVDAKEPSHLKVTSVCDQQSACNNDKQADSHSLNWDGLREDRNQADYATPYSVTRCASRVDNPKSKDDWSDDINAAYKEDWTGAITPYEDGRYNFIDTLDESGWDDEGLRIAVINLHPDDLAYDLERTAAR